MPREYDDDDMPVRREPLSGMDAFFANNFVLAIFLSLCCNGVCLIPLILNIIGVATCKDPTAKSNARTCLIISCVMVVIGIVANIVQFAMQQGGGPRRF